jgi:hypothetical protein
VYPGPTEDYWAAVTVKAAVVVAPDVTVTVAGDAGFVVSVELTGGVIDTL